MRTVAYAPLRSVKVNQPVKGNQPAKVNQFLGWLVIAWVWPACFFAVMFFPIVIFSPGLTASVAAQVILHPPARLQQPEEPADDALAACAVTRNLRPMTRSSPWGDRTVIYLGRLTQEPYVVAVPGRDRTAVEALRRCVPDALILPSRRGSYIHVASFSDRAAAERLSQHLRHIGFDARVAYFQPLRHP